MYKQIKGLFQKSQLTNLAAFEKLFRICDTIHLLASLQQIISKACKRLRKFSMEARRR